MEISRGSETTEQAGWEEAPTSGDGLGTVEPAPETARPLRGDEGEASDEEAATPAEQPGATEAPPEAVDQTSLQETGPNAAEAWRDRPLGEFRDQYPDEYIEPTTPAAEHVRDKPFEHPQEWVGSINPKFDEGPAYTSNCCDCSRAVERTWRGQPEVAAGRADEMGESEERIESWAGMAETETTFDEVEQRLTDGGHGSSALVGIVGTRSDGRTYGHELNAVNHEGTVLYVDGQDGTYGEWPPPTPGTIDHVYAVGVGPDNRRPLW
jgi:hypothetical protein